MRRKKWWTIRYYSPEYGFDSKIHVNEFETGPIEEYAKLICGNRDLWFSIQRGKK